MYAHPSGGASRRIPQLACASMIVTLVLFYFLPAAAQTEGPNLVPNPTLETQNPSNMNQPLNWLPGGFGTNTCAHNYPATPAHDGTKAANVTISSYTSGDCKWFFQDIAVTPGRVMRMSYYLTSDIPSWATAQFHFSDGSFQWPNLASPPASPNLSTFKNVGRYFVVPANAQTMTLFPLIKNKGTLTIDTVELHEVTVTPLPLQPIQSGNIVTNPSFEQTSGGQPVSWNPIQVNPATCPTCQVTYSLVAGIDGPTAAQVTVSQYALSQAANKEGFGWKTEDMQVVGGATYNISDDYIADAESFVTLEIGERNADGSITTVIQDLAKLMPGLNAQGFKTTFTFPTNAVSVAFLHHLKNVGKLTVDAVSIASASGADPSQFAQGMVSLTLDDCNEDQITNALPALNTAGLHATFYVITHRLDASGFFTTSQTLSLANQGHEIGNHTQTHPDLTTVSAAQLQAETQGAEQDFVNIGLHPVTFAYPFGAYNATVIQAVKNISGMIGARSTDDGVNLRTDSHFTLKRMNMGNTTQLADVETAIDSAVQNKQWLILVFHHVVPNPSDGFSVSPAFFQDIVNYLVQKNVKVVTTAQGIQLMAP